MKYLKIETATRKGKVCPHWNPGIWTVPEVNNGNARNEGNVHGGRYSRKLMTTTELTDIS